MKNKLIDLNNHLFMQIERLSEENIKGDRLKEEIERAKTITSVAKEIIQTGRLALDAQKAVIGGMLADAQVPEVLRLEGNNNGQKKSV